MVRWLRIRLLSRPSLILISIMFFAMSAYVLGWSSILTVKQVIVIGAPTKIDRGIISQEISLGDRMARVNPRAVATELKKFSWLKEAKVERNWMNGAVTITVSTRKPIAIVGENFLDAENVTFSLPHPERFKVPIILASNKESIEFATTLIESLSIAFRKQVEVISVAGLQTATLLINRSTESRKPNLTVRWGDAGNTSLKMRVYQSLLALPENVNIIFMDLSAPHAPIVR